MMQVANKILISVVLLFLYGCQHTTQNKMTKEELENYFSDNKSELIKLVNICESNPSIKRVEHNTSYFYGMSKPEDVNTVNKLQKIIKLLNIDTIQCTRDETTLKGELLGVSFNLYASGFVFSGELQSIDFDTQRYRDLFKNKNRITIPWQKVFPLSEEGWKIIYSK